MPSIRCSFTSSMAGDARDVRRAFSEAFDSISQEPVPAAYPGQVNIIHKSAWVTGKERVRYGKLHYLSHVRKKLGFTPEQFARLDDELYIVIHDPIVRQAYKNIGYRKEKFFAAYFDRFYARWGPPFGIPADNLNFHRLITRMARLQDSGPKENTKQRSSERSSGVVQKDVDFALHHSDIVHSNDKDPYDFPDSDRQTEILDREQPDNANNHIHRTSSGLDRGYIDLTVGFEPLAEPRPPTRDSEASTQINPTDQQNNTPERFTPATPPTRPQSVLSPQRPIPRPVHGLAYQAADDEDIMFCFSYLGQEYMHHISEFCNPGVQPSVQNIDYKLVLLKVRHDYSLHYRQISVILYLPDRRWHNQMVDEGHSFINLVRHSLRYDKEVVLFWIEAGHPSYLVDSDGEEVLVKTE